MVLPFKIGLLVNQSGVLLKVAIGVQFEIKKLDITHRKEAAPLHTSISK